MTDFVLIMPEILLAATLLLVLIAEISYHGEQVRLTAISSLLGLIAVFVQTLVSYQYGATQVFNHTLAVDGLSLFFKLLFTVLAAIAIIAAMHSNEIPRRDRTEYFVLVLASCLGMCLAASAAHMLLAFLSLQLINLLAFFLCGYARDSIRSTEASIKYMVFAALSAGLMLYGLGLLFANTGSLNIHDIHRALLAKPAPTETLLVVFTLVFLSLCFHFAAFPMYLWAPDVLEGAPTPASSFVSVGTRAAGFAVGLRFFIVVFAQPGEAPGAWATLPNLNWTAIVAIVAAITMGVGGLLAIRQTAAKRLVGCLVVAQSGFLLTGLIVLDQVGIAALLYNLVVELFAVTGIFYVIAFLKNELDSDELPNLKGMLRRAVPECICLILFLLCLVGMPPTPGFIGKFALIGALIRHRWLGLAALAIAAMMLTVVGVAKLAFSLIGDARPLRAEPVAANAQRKVFLALLVAPILLVGVFADSVFRWAGGSLGFILW